MARTAGQSSSVYARTPTSAGRSSGQQGRGASAPITASAACGSPVQQDWLTETTVVVPTLASRTKPGSASLRTWCEQVDWLIPARTARSPTVSPSDDVATACSTRTRVASPRQANQSAKTAALSVESADVAGVPAMAASSSVVDGCVNRRPSIR